MYYSNGNYEAFARPRKPKNVDQKSAYIIGGGLAGLATAIFLVRDGQMSGEKIHMGTSKNTSRASRASNLSLIYSLFLVNFCL